MQRLDRILSEAGCGSRRELKALIRGGAVSVNGEVVRREDEKFDPQTAEILLRGAPIRRPGAIWLMMNKPLGVVSATQDAHERTVMELLPEEYRQIPLFPVGRLDKMTEGLLLFTNDGEAAHRVISPRHAVEKEYEAQHEGCAEAADVQAFAAGIVLRDGTLCRPAVLLPLGPGLSRIIVTEGKYHQVRRMMAARGLTVTALRRLREGKLHLGALEPGACRRLTDAEIASLTGSAELAGDK